MSDIMAKGARIPTHSVSEWPGLGMAKFRKASLSGRKALKRLVA